MPNLAINGGPKVRNSLLPRQKTVDEQEYKAIAKFFCGENPAVLSGFRGSWGPNFNGGSEIQKFEAMATDFFFGNRDVGAIAINSCTSGLQVACGAIGLKPGDEVIVTPWSMTCSATAPMIYGAKPVFADIEPEYFCLDPDSVERKITDKTKAIIVVDLFGQPYDPRIDEIADKHGLYVIEDAAQAIGSKRGDDYAGTLADIGCFSFTQGKHLTAGEGGLMLFSDKYTKDPEIFYRAALLMNHAEAVVNGMPTDMIRKYHDLVGFNMRMTEMQAAILQVQLKKLPQYVHHREHTFNMFKSELKDIDYLRFAETREGCSHSYYVMPIHFDAKKAGVKRASFVAAVKAELMEETGRIDRGVPFNNGYIDPLYRMPLFSYNEDYRGVECPVAEKLHNEGLITSLLHCLDLWDFKQDGSDVILAIEKVHMNREELRRTELERGSSL